MIERVIESSIRNRFLVLVATAALSVFAVYATLNTPVDAIPDLGENQVIVFTDWMGRSPREIEDQVTYPLSLKLQGLAGVRTVRSSSEFNFSMITANFAAGGGVVQKNNAEYLVRFVGWIKGKEDVENTILRRDSGGAPVRVRDVAAVQLGQQFRRSVFEKDGSEVTGGVVLMRHGENPLAVTARVKATI